MTQALVLFDVALLGAILYQSTTNLNKLQISGLLQSLVMLVGLLMIENAHFDFLPILSSAFFFAAIKALWLAYLYRQQESCIGPGSIRKLGPGLHYVRHCDTYERRVIQEAFDSVAQVFEQTNKENAAKDALRMTWVNLYASKDWRKDSPDKVRKELMEVCMKMVRESDLYPDPYMVSISFLYGPAGNKNNQQFHIDYLPTVCDFFVPITKATLANTTQIIENVPLVSKDYDAKYHVKQKVADDFYSPSEGPGTRAVQTAFSPWSLVQLNPNTIHRGVANNAPEAKDRVFLCICFNDKFLDVGEYPETTNFALCSEQCPPDCKKHYWTKTSNDLNPDA